MAINARLRKATLGLSGRQRAALVLRAQSEGQEVDPEIHKNIPDEQERRIFNRYMALGYVINRELGAVGRIIAERTDSLENGRYYFNLFSDAAGIAEKQEGFGQPVRAPKDWRKEPEVSLSQLLRGLIKEVRDEVLESLALRWQELRALETVWAELASEFDGEDPVHPDLRAQAADTAARLRALAEALAAKRRLVEPDDALLDQYRSHINASFQQLGLAGIYQ